MPRTQAIPAGYRAAATLAFELHRLDRDEVILEWRLHPETVDVVREFVDLSYPLPNEGIKLIGAPFVLDDSVPEGVLQAVIG